MHANLGLMEETSMHFGIMATFSGTDEYAHDMDMDTIEHCCREAGLSVDVSEPGDSEYDYLAKESESEAWEGIYDITVSGILDRETFTRWVEDLGLYAEDVRTLGTLGGPGNPMGLYPDIAFAGEYLTIIESVRVSPLPDVGPPASLPNDEAWANHAWERVRGAVLTVYGA